MTSPEVIFVLCVWILACAFSPEVRRRTLNLFIALEATGLLAPGRALQILDAPVQANESLLS